jgi:mannan endo-1,4-beta-mannosidase
MAWEVANEPRIWNVENEKAFTNWLNEVASTIKSIDKNHLLTTGSEGKAGSNDDIAAFERTHNNPNIDYLTMHIWPKIGVGIISTTRKIQPKLPSKKQMSTLMNI